MRTSLSRITSSLCSVAMRTITPPTATGSSTANGLSAPVRPTLTPVSAGGGVGAVGGDLKPTPRGGSAPDGAECLLLVAPVDLDDTAVDVVVELGTPLH